MIPSASEKHLKNEKPLNEQIKIVRQYYEMQQKMMRTDMRNSNMASIQISPVRPDEKDANRKNSIRNSNIYDNAFQPTAIYHRPIRLGPAAA